MNELRDGRAKFLVDCIITEDDDSFLSRFNPAKFVETIRRTGADLVIVHAACCNGNYHYQSPSAAGRACEKP